MEYPATGVVLFQVTESDLGRLAEMLIEKYEARHPRVSEESQLPGQTETESGPKFYTRKEVATMLGCSLPTVHQLLNTGVLRYTKLGGKTLIFKDYADKQIECGALAKYRKRIKKGEE